MECSGWFPDQTVTPINTLSRRTQSSGLLLRGMLLVIKLSQTQGHFTSTMTHGQEAPKGGVIVDQICSMI